MDGSIFSNQERRQDTPESGVLPPGQTERRGQHLKLAENTPESERRDSETKKYRPITSAEINTHIAETNKILQEKWEKSFTDQGIPVPERKKVLTIAALQKREAELREAILEAQATEGKALGDGETVDNTKELDSLEAELASVVTELQGSIENKKKWQDALDKQRADFFIAPVIRQYEKADFTTDSHIERKGKQKEVKELLDVAIDIDQRKALNFILARLKQADESYAQDLLEREHTLATALEGNSQPDQRTTESVEEQNVQENTAKPVGRFKKIRSLFRRNKNDGYVHPSKLLRTSTYLSSLEGNNEPTTDKVSERKDGNGGNTTEPPVEPKEPKLKKLRQTVELLGEGFNRGKNPEAYMRIQENAPSSQGKALEKGVETPTESETPQEADKVPPQEESPEQKKQALIERLRDVILNGERVIENAQRIRAENQKIRQALQKELELLEDTPEDAIEEISITPEERRENSRKKIEQRREAELANPKARFHGDKKYSKEGAVLAFKYLSKRITAKEMLDTPEYDSLKISELKAKHIADKEASHWKALFDKINAKYDKMLDKLQS